VVNADFRPHIREAFSRADASAQSGFPFSVVGPYGLLQYGYDSSGASAKALLCSAVNQLPSLTPSCFAPLTRRIPAASSGLKRPASDAGAELAFGKKGTAAPPVPAERLRTT
jgi:hypothetical protein